MNYLNKIGIIILAVIFGACEEKDTSPVFSEMTPQQITMPVTGDAFIIATEILDSNFVIKWSAATYDAKLAKPTYTVEMDAINGTFVKPVVLKTTSDLSVLIKYNDMNKYLTVNFGLKDSVATDFKLRITSNIAKQLNQISEEIVVTLTPWFKPADPDTTTPPPVADTLYLVGNATLAGWNNASGLPIIKPANGTKYTITTTLTAGGMKVLRELGKWAPQWGDDGNFDGGLKYRPDEATTDPAEIPSPGDGTFKIDVDIENLTYTITPI